MYGGCAPGYAYAVAPPQPKGRVGSLCGSVAIVVALVFFLWWLFSSSGDSGKTCVVQVASSDRPREELLIYGDAQQKSCAAPVAPRPKSNLSLEAVTQGATAPLDVGSPLVGSLGGLNLRDSSLGTSLDGAFEMSDVTKEYMEAYNPTGLASVMPAGWKSQKPSCEGAGAGAFAEFSRYSISPEAVAKSENMRSVLRLSENTRQQMSRTLGSDSLLRNAVTPIGPYPVGDRAMLWNDSSVRQAYIAAATGAFPSLGDC